ncbi:MAG: hypothetical protein MJ175_07175 [Clostridia bacterium]|nr:hypothetical protein [Clostridia bacterium]
MKKLSFFLAALLAASSLMASCGDTATAPTETQKVNDTKSVETEEVDPMDLLTSGVPEGTDFGGEVVHLWYTTNSISVAETYIDIAGQLDGDILNDAIYNANIAVEDKLNVDLDFFNSGVTTDNTGNSFNKLMLANDTSIDLFSLIQWNSAKFAAEGMFYNMFNAKYLSYDQPWWDYTYMKEMTIGNDRIFALSGDFTVDRSRCLDCIYYNKQMFADFYEDADGLYQEVLDHKWTIERFRKIAEEVYSDLNNNGQIDREDRVGYCINSYNNLDGFFSGAGARTTARDENDIPYLVLNNDRTINVCDAIYAIARDTVGGYNSGTAYEEDVKNREMFCHGDSMFLIGFFYTAENMRDMKNDYGVVPMPLYDEAQEQYVSDVHDIMSIMAVPYNITKLDTVSAVLEELAFTGYKDVLPSYYEVLLKNKYARDSISASMIDLIRDNCKPDIAHIYGDPFGTMGYIVREMVQGKKPFASKYTSMEKNALKQMQKFIDKYTSIE